MSFALPYLPSSHPLTAPPDPSAARPLPQSVLTLSLPRLARHANLPSPLAVIPKPSDTDKEGLVIGWPAQQANMDELKKYWEEVKGKL